MQKINAYVCISPIKGTNKYVVYVKYEDDKRHKKYMKSEISYLDVESLKAKKVEKLWQISLMGVFNPIDLTKKTLDTWVDIIYLEQANQTRIKSKD